jgi:hypothetical protein
MYTSTTVYTIAQAEVVEAVLYVRNNTDYVISVLSTSVVNYVNYKTGTVVKTYSGAGPYYRLSQIHHPTDI